MIQDGSADEQCSPLHGQGETTVGASRGGAAGCLEIEKKLRRRKKTLTSERSYGIILWLIVIHPGQKLRV